jgi:hypothetical protein
MKLSLVLGGALALAACSNPTQIVLSIDTTVGIPCDIDKIVVRARGSSEATFEQELEAGARLPIVVKLSDETSDGSFMLEVVGVKAGAEVLKAQGQLTFGNADAGEHVILNPDCTAAKPCMLADLDPSTRTPAPVTGRFQCGDAVRAYMPSNTSETFIDACTVVTSNSGQVLDMGARGAVKLPLEDAVLSGFGFRFYGQPIRQIWAHEDGYISFATDNPDARNDLDPGSFDRQLLGTGVPPPPRSIFAFWDTLTLSSSGVCYALEGTSPNQKLRVTWSGTCQTTSCSSDSLNFTIVLDERTQKVSLTYGPMMAANMARAQGATATVGIVNDAKGCPVSKCTQSTGLCDDNATPCGYTQIFSKMAQPGGVQGVDFTPITAK